MSPLLLRSRWAKSMNASGPLTRKIYPFILCLHLRAMNKTHVLFGTILVTIMMLIIPTHFANASSCSASASSVGKHSKRGGAIGITFSSPDSCSVAAGVSHTAGGFENFAGKSSCAGMSAANFPSGSGGSGSGSVSCHSP